MPEFAAVAFMCCYNEADILPWTIRHLLDQGVGVYVIDNWSADGSAEIAQSFPLVGWERFPPQGPPCRYAWESLLRRADELAMRCGASWCALHDADEIRRSPRPGEALLEAFARVEREGYNAVNHTVYQFWPTDESYAGDPEGHFRCYSTDGIDARIPHVKAWKNERRLVQLQAHGGHMLSLREPRICPEKFILKHYPIRSSAHAERKIMRERRYDPAEVRLGWHRQYDGVIKTRQWIRDEATLTEWPMVAEVAA